MNMYRFHFSLAVLAAVLSLSLAGCRNREHQIHSRDFISPPFTVDAIYKSMQGPVQSIAFDLLESERPELVWLTGFGSRVVDGEGQPITQTYMCHTNLVYRGLVEHQRTIPSELQRTKLFTISQGEEEARFPEGFGMPVLSNVRGASFGVFNQLLNMNYRDFARVRPQIRYKNTIHFIREKERARPIRPLYPALAQIMVSVNREQAIFNLATPTKLQEEASCSRGDSASMVFPDSHDQRFTYHWKLKPGRETRRTLITNTMLKLKHDTTIHYIAAHMHPYGERLTFKDLTENRVLFESKMTMLKDRLGVEKVEHYSSAEGLPVYRDHEYMLESVYNNTSGEEQDAMAIMYFFLLDKTFQLPD